MPRLVSPFTAIGAFAVVLAVVGYVAGWQLGWIELIVIATGSALALVAAVPFVIGRMRLDVERSLSARRVMVGEPASAEIDIRNPRATAVRPRVLSDRVPGGHRTIHVPRLAGNATHHVDYPLATGARGRYDIGPAVFTRTDPLHLLRRDVVHSELETLWVHPRYEAVRALPVGYAKDLEGPTSDTSPIGDVAFHSLREYEPGDDYRHIHWMSTARRGVHEAPLLRHYVDNRRPHLGVLLDDRASAMGPTEFEIAVEITASLAASSFVHGAPVSVWATSTILLGRGTGGGRNDLLDRLALIRQSDAGVEPLDIANREVRAERSVSAVAFVTGPTPPSELLAFVSRLRRRARVIVVRVFPTGSVERAVLPGARLIDVDGRRAFVHQWNALVA